eukprot:scaffold5900_cov89-Skeletonema_dohrnii-CCMP3373.AAC.4
MARAMQGEMGIRRKVNMYHAHAIVRAIYGKCTSVPERSLYHDARSISCDARSSGNGHPLAIYGD